MTPQEAIFLKNVYLAQTEHESKTTRRVLGAVPADKCGYKPDPKSMGSLELAWHLASAECFFLNGVAKGEFARGEGGSGIPENIKSCADVIKWYDENFPKALAAVSAMSGDKLAAPINFFGMFEFPAVEYLSLNLRHGIHHRGQLSAYLRPMGAKVPGIYGPSGDEPVKAPANA